MKHRLIIRKDSTIEWLNPPPFPIPIERQKRQRFSEIIPLDPIKCIAFRILRKLFGEDGKVAAWTRGWRTIWIGRILIGCRRGEEFISPFRQAVLDWEREVWFSPRCDL
jgi:hypothetical protein